MKSLTGLVVSGIAIGSVALIGALRSPANLVPFICWGISMTMFLAILFLLVMSEKMKRQISTR